MIWMICFGFVSARFTALVGIMVISGIPAKFLATAADKLKM